MIHIDVNARIPSRDVAASIVREIKNGKPPSPVHVDSLLLYHMVKPVRIPRTPEVWLDCAVDATARIAEDECAFVNVRDCRAIASDRRRAHVVENAALRDGRYRYKSGQWARDKATSHLASKIYTQIKNLTENVKSKPRGHLHHGDFLKLPRALQGNRLLRLISPTLWVDEQLALQAFAGVERGQDPWVYYNDRCIWGNTSWGHYVVMGVH